MDEGRSERAAERMADFFDARAADYDDHMRANVADFAAFYAAVADAACGAVADHRAAPLRVLDLGCGTGLELRRLLQGLPDARVVGLDLSAHMLRRLLEKHGAAHLAVVQGSYLALPFRAGTPAHGFDLALSVQTMHHLLPDAKRALYARVRRLLRPGGVYVEGDYVVSAAQSAEALAAYCRRTAELDLAGAGTHHIDIPLSLETQRRLLTEAGFTDFHLVRHAAENAVYVVRA